MGNLPRIMLGKKRFVTVIAELDVMSCHLVLDTAWKSMVQNCVRSIHPLVPVGMVGIILDAMSKVFRYATDILVSSPNNI